MTRVAFAWPELPDYAARCIRAVIARRGEAISVVGTKPTVPIRDMERSLGQSVQWIETDDALITWSTLNVGRPDVLFVGGYGVPAFVNLEREVRNAGGKIVLMSDNNWQETLLRNTVGSLRHRLLFRRRFDAIFVPGASGARLAQSWGYRSNNIAIGLYGADPSLFSCGPPLMERPKTFLFIGQFIARKNVVGLAEAFVRFAANHSDWSLSLCGDGVQRDQIHSHPRISIHGFVQPPQLAQLLRTTRCLVLPSVEEHWGLVVHEAALNGCALALSRTVGAAEDLARQGENAVIFPAGDVAAIEASLSKVASWEGTHWAVAQRVSRERAAAFGPEVFADSVDALITRLHKAQIQ